MHFRIGLLIVVVYSGLTQATTLRVVVPDFPPYTFQYNGQIAGIGIDQVEPVFQRLNIEYRISMVANYDLAVVALREGKADCLLMATQSAERDKIARFSEPMLVNRWSWFLNKNSILNPKSSAFKQQARIGTIQGSNTHGWLKSSGFKVVLGYPVDHQLAELLLQSAQLNALFMSEIVFLDMINRRGLSADQYQQYVEISQPFGIYVSKAFLEKNPQFLIKLNREILANRPPIF